MPLYYNISDEIYMNNFYFIYVERKKYMSLFSSELRKLIHSSRLSETKNYIQHGKTSCFKHTVAVAYISCKIADKLHISVNKQELIRGALLHDYFLYDWHDKSNKKHNLHGFTHPYDALKNADKDFSLTEKERNIIKCHMFPLTPFPPKYREGIIVCIADKYCSLLETFKSCPYISKYRKDNKYVHHKSLFSLLRFV